MSLLTTKKNLLLLITVAFFVALTGTPTEVDPTAQAAAARRCCPGGYIDGCHYPQVGYTVSMLELLTDDARILKVNKLIFTLKSIYFPQLLGTGNPDLGLRPRAVAGRTAI